MVRSGELPVERETVVHDHPAVADQHPGISDRSMAPRWASSVQRFMMKRSHLAGP